MGGCCYASAISVISGMGSATGLNRTESNELAMSIRNATNTVRQVCTDSNFPLVSHINASACPIATTRNGGISSGTVPDAPAAPRTRRRLKFRFNGELSSLSTARRDALKASIKSKVESALGAGTVESVTLSSGSIVADVEFSEDVDGDEVAALSTDSSIIQMQPSDGTTTFQQATAPESTTDTSTSGAAGIATMFGLVLGLISVVIIM